MLVSAMEKLFAVLVSQLAAIGNASIPSISAGFAITNSLDGNGLSMTGLLRVLMISALKVAEFKKTLLGAVIELSGFYDQP